MKLDEELRAALTRRNAPAGFAERTMARIAADAEKQRRRVHKRSGPPLLPRLAAAAILAVILGGVTVREVGEHRRIVEGERARRDVMTALHIAGDKVRAAQREVRGSVDQ